MYINGATAVPCVNTTNVPNRKSVTIIGINQNFFLFNKKLKNSLTNSSIIKIDF